MHKYRTHTCGQLRKEDSKKIVKISGWVHRKRDHGNLLFLDIRDHYGITQCVFNEHNEILKDQASAVKNESVITVSGEVILRSNDTVNSTLSTGEIELLANELIIDCEADPLPLQVNSDKDLSEDIRLRYRFLDLRREKIHNNIMLRSKIIAEIRANMSERGFTEFQTPILTASSPEGARDFLVPSRLHPGKFYALPQAPQQFKQLLMISGFDKYFQIAPCFRDEDSRADRSPGEFYQLDLEMSFVTQDDIFNEIEPVLYNIFTKFSNKKVTKPSFPRIPYQEAMLKYGSDKPDLRNPIIISDVTEVFKNSEFTIFKQNIEKGQIVRAIPVKEVASMPRSFFDKMNQFAIDNEAPGLGYISFVEGAVKGPIAKFLTPQNLEDLKNLLSIKEGDCVFFVCDMEDRASKLAGKLRAQFALDLNLINNDSFEFCWVVDFPFYEWNEEKKMIDFAHNPFSMPHGEMEALTNATTKEDLLKIKAFQYDIVCNGIELSSGAVRNHKVDIMYKAFEHVGYTKERVEAEFGGMIKALKYGAPPHGGLAPGIDRMIMLIAEEPNIREVIAFPMNQNAEDILMNAPCEVDPKHLRELGISIKSPKLNVN